VGGKSLEAIMQAGRGSGTKLTKGLAAVALLGLLAGCGSSNNDTSSTAPASSPSTPTTTSGTSAAAKVLGTAATPLGTILVDGNGMTVYMFAADTMNQSNCTGTCLSYWPLVPAPAKLPATLPGVSAKVGSIDRPDGSSQLTVNGMPVYTYAGDNSPGETTGQGLNTSGGLWWVLSPSGSIIKDSGGAPSSSGPPSPSGGGY
jgi:predicted lipoprotein with Yx(FWY)xxD motif